MPWVKLLAKMATEQVLITYWDIFEHDMTNKVHSPFGVSLWRSIRVLWPFIRNHTSIKVNNEYKTSFCKDNWLGVSDRFTPILMTVADAWSSDGWNMQFRRNLYD